MVDSYMQQYYLDHKDEIKARSLKRYYETREADRPKKKQRAKVYQENLKLEVLTRYGNGMARCVICGEDRLPCLSIDHINGDGAKHRRELFGSNTSSRTYSWLKKNDYPEGFQTLCMNCQWVKKFEELHYGTKETDLVVR